MTTVTVSRDYCGISDVAHGGYVAGLLAERYREPTRVTLRQAPPLETPLSIEEGDDGTAVLRHPDGGTVMEARPVPAIDTRLPTVGVEEARSRPPHPRIEAHPFPDCFSCGTRRPDGFGLRFSAPDERGLTVGAWTPTGPLVPGQDTVPAAFVWAVIDCATAWSSADHWDDRAWWPAVTGQIAVTLIGEVHRDREHVVAGRLVGREGRRILIEAAVSDSDGQLRAIAETTWVVVPGLPQGRP